MTVEYEELFALQHKLAGQKRVASPTTPHTLVNAYMPCLHGLSTTIHCKREIHYFSYLRMAMRRYTFATNIEWLDAKQKAQSYRQNRKKYKEAATLYMPFWVQPAMQEDIACTIDTHQSAPSHELRELLKAYARFLYVLLMSRWSLQTSLNSKSSTNAPVGKRFLCP